MKLPSNPLISIIIPLHNGENDIRSCLDSLLNQTYKNIEIILESDSIDHSKAICEKYAAEYPTKIRYFNEIEGFSGVARNKGMKECKGEYIMFCNGGDSYILNACELLIQSALNHEVDIVVANHYRQCQEDVHREYPYDFYTNIFVFQEEKIRACKPHVFAKLFKKSFLEKHDILFTDDLLYEDFPFSYRALYLAPSLFYISIPVYWHIVEPDSNHFNISTNSNILASIETFINHYKKDIKEEEELLIDTNHIWIDKAIESYSNLIYNSIPKNNKMEREYERIIKVYGYKKLLSKHQSKNMIEKIGIMFIPYFMKHPILFFKSLQKWLKKERL